MNPTTDFDDDVPFVREECGDTMWDNDVLNALTALVEQRPPVPPVSTETAPQPVNLSNK